MSSKQYTGLVKIKCSEPKCIWDLTSTDKGETVETARVYLKEKGWASDGSTDADYCPKHKDNLK